MAYNEHMMSRPVSEFVVNYEKIMKYGNSILEHIVTQEQGTLCQLWFIKEYSKYNK